MRARSYLIFLFGILALVAHCQEEDSEESPQDEEEGEGGDEPDDDANKVDDEKLKAVHDAIDVNKDGKVSKVEMHEFTKKIRLASSKNISSSMEEMDSDKDGKVSEAEFMKDVESLELELLEEDKAEQKLYVDHQKVKFKAADRNKDGFLNAEELPAMMDPGLYDDVLSLEANYQMNLRDKDGNGELTPKEFWMASDADNAGTHEADRLEVWGVLDKDKSGTLNLMEYKHYESGMHDTELALDHIFQVADTDKDDHVTAEELIGQPELHEQPQVHTHFWEWAEALTGHGGEL